MATEGHHRRGEGARALAARWRRDERLRAVCLLLAIDRFVPPSPRQAAWRARAEARVAQLAAGEGEA